MSETDMAVVAGQTVEVVVEVADSELMFSVTPDRTVILRIDAKVRTKGWQALRMDVNGGE